VPKLQDPSMHIFPGPKEGVAFEVPGLKSTGAEG